MQLNKTKNIIAAATYGKMHNGKSNFHATNYLRVRMVQVKTT
jgi:hypothetical protein